MPNDLPTNNAAAMMDAHPTSYVPLVGGALSGGIKPHPSYGTLRNVLGEGGAGFLGGLKGGLLGTGTMLGLNLLTRGKLGLKSNILAGLTGSSLGTHVGSQWHREGIPLNARAVANIAPSSLPATVALAQKASSAPPFVAKRKLENHVQATGDRMSMTPQQFGMNIALMGEKKSFVVGGTIGALGGLATSKKNKRMLGAGRGALIGGGTELGMYPGAVSGGLGGLALGGLISALVSRKGDHLENMLTGGALGAGAGALGGGYLGNIASRALLDDSSHSKQDEKKKKEETKEAFGIYGSLGGDNYANFRAAQPQMGQQFETFKPNVIPGTNRVDNRPAWARKHLVGAPGSRPTDIMALNSGLERVLNNGKAIAAGNGGVAGPRPGAPMNIPGQVKNTLSMFGVNQRPAKPSLLGTASDVAEQVTGGSPTLSTMPQQPKFLGGGVAGR